MQTIRITTSQNIDIDYEVAGAGDRILARLLDYALFILILILGVIIGSLTIGKIDNSLTIIVLVIIYAVLYVFYDLVCEVWMNGQSVGKRVMKIKVISLDGARPTFGQYLMRWLFRFVDFTLTSGLCGLICVLVSDKKQRVGDIVANTTLIKTEPRALMNNLVFTPPAESYTPVFNEASQLTDKDINLLHEVTQAYFETGNTEVVYSAAARIKQLLSIASSPAMDDLLFLQTIIKDYNHLNSANDLQTNS
jgi:uncharacterized RDD family membrane protein YckC